MINSILCRAAAQPETRAYDDGARTEQSRDKRAIFATVKHDLLNARRKIPKFSPVRRTVRLTDKLVNEYRQIFLCFPNIYASTAGNVARLDIGLTPRFVRRRGLPPLHTRI